MNKKQVNLEKMIAMVMISYTIGCLVGESIRDAIYRPETAARPVEDATYRNGNVAIMVWRGDTPLTRFGAVLPWVP